MKKYLVGLGLLVGFITPVTALAYGTCPTNTTASAFAAANPTLQMMTLTSSGTTDLSLGNTAGLFPYGMICDLTNSAGYVLGQAGNFGAFTPLLNTNGNPYMSQTPGDILVYVSSTSYRFGGTDTGYVFFKVDSNGLVQPLTPPVTQPTDKDQCKKGGWKSFSNPSFKNQGQCVSFTNHSDKEDDE